MRKKITLIGAGQIGGTLAHLIALKQLGNVVLFDVAAGVAKGKALDIAQSSPVDGFDINLTGTDKYEDTRNSDVIIVTAGVPRKPGMTRDDLLGINLKIIKQVANGIKNTSPNAFVICITNPLDVIVMALQKYSGMPKNKIIGMAGILDSSRFIYFLSRELKISVNKIKSFVLGGHGDSMVPMLESTTVDGKKITDLITAGKISKEKLDEIVDRTKKGGAEIVKYLEKGSAFYAPAASGVEMAESYLKNLKKQLPCAAYLTGEYNFKHIYAGVPVVIGSEGVEKVIELKLSEEEKKNFVNSVKAVQDLYNAAKKIDPDL
jgi:malate dehydrogenase